MLLTETPPSWMLIIGIIRSWNCSFNLIPAVGVCQSSFGRTYGTFNELILLIISSRIRFLDLLEAAFARPVIQTANKLIALYVRRIDSESAAFVPAHTAPERLADFIIVQDEKMAFVDSCPPANNKSLKEANSGSSVRCLA